MNVVTKFMCLMMIDLCKNGSERHIEVFNGGVLCIIAGWCIFVCLTVWDCRQN